MTDARSIAVWPLLGGAGPGSLSGAYAHPLIFLFLGGFLLARAIERSGLHRRIANAALRLAGRTETMRVVVESTDEASSAAAGTPLTSTSGISIAIRRGALPVERLMASRG